MDSIDPGALRAPTRKDEVLAGIIRELVGVLAVITDPNLSVVGVGVHAEGLEAEGTCKLGAIGCAQGIGDEVITGAEPGWPGKESVEWFFAVLWYNLLRCWGLLLMDMTVVVAEGGREGLPKGEGGQHH